MLIFFLALAANFYLAQAEVRDAPRGVDYRLDADLSYFSTQSNFTAGGGSTEDLPDSGYFTELVTRFLYTQDLGKMQRLYGGFTYSMVESDDGFTTRENSGLNEILMGGQLWLNSGSLHLVPQADLVYPLFRIDRNSDDALLGEGAMKIRGGSWLILPYGNFIPFVYVSYEYRDEGRSHNLPYSVGAKLQMDSLWLQGEFRGYERLISNEDTETRAARDAFLQRVNGGSYRYYSMNPAVGELAGSAGITVLDSWMIYGGVAYTIRGSSAAEGLTGTIGLAYTPNPGNSSSRRRSSTPNFESGTETLKEADQYFNEDPRVPPRPKPSTPKQDASELLAEPIQEVPETAPAKPKNDGMKVQMRAKPKAKPKAKKPAKPKRTKKLDKLLRDAEKNLENM